MSLGSDREIGSKSKSDWVKLEDVAGSEKEVQKFSTERGKLQSKAHRNILLNNDCGGEGTINYAIFSSFYNDAGDSKSSKGFITFEPFCGGH